MDADFWVQFFGDTIVIALVFFLVVYCRWAWRNRG